MEFCKTCLKKDVCKYKEDAEEFGKQIEKEADPKYDFIKIKYDCKYKEERGINILRDLQK